MGGGSPFVLVIVWLDALSALERLSDVGPFICLYSIIDFISDLSSLKN